MERSPRPRRVAADSRPRADLQIGAVGFAPIGWCTKPRWPNYDGPMNAVKKWDCPEQPIRNTGFKDKPKLVQYWRWRSSNLLFNTERGVFAEFLVASSLRLTEEAHKAWAEYDLLLPNANGGRGTRIEVKSSAYLQAPEFKQTKDATIQFGIAPVEVDEKLTRPSDVYVFCHFTPRFEERDTADPLDVAQWDFYLLATKQLDRELPGQKTIRLGPLKKLAGDSVQFSKLEKRIKEVAPKIPS